MQPPHSPRSQTFLAPVRSSLSRRTSRSVSLASTASVDLLAVDGQGDRLALIDGHAPLLRRDRLTEERGQDGRAQGARAHALDEVPAADAARILLVRFLYPWSSPRRTRLREASAGPGRRATGPGPPGTPSAGAGPGLEGAPGTLPPARPAGRSGTTGPRRSARSRARAGRPCP